MESESPRSAGHPSWETVEWGDSLFCTAVTQTLSSAERARHGRVGRVLEAIGGVYRVQVDEAEEIEASLRGRLKHAARAMDRVVTGDFVVVSNASSSGSWTIEEVQARRNRLVRAAPGGQKPKIVVANLDHVMVVLSAFEPAFDFRAADRFLVLAEACGIPSVVILNKMDLPGAPAVAQEVLQAYEQIGYSVLRTSAQTGQGLERVKPLLEGGVSALVGPSGVGKSSIMNTLFPKLNLRTKPVSRRGGRGRHTTVGACLLPLTAGGWVADTPGFSEVGLWRVGSPELSDAFPEFREPAEGCRFRGCTHSHEPDCAVLDAVEEGQIREERYKSYRALLEEG